MKALREILTLVTAWCLLFFGGPPAYADLNLTTNWERPVIFKVVDAESDAPLSQPLLIIKSEKRTEGNAGPLPFYDVIRGSVAGLANYKVDVKSADAEVWAIVPGYKLTIHRMLWKELPDRQIDSSGIEMSVPMIPLALKPLGKSSEWQREFRLVVAPELEDLLELKPPYLSSDEHRVISEFLNRERDRMLGL